MKTQQTLHLLAALLVAAFAIQVHAQNNVITYQGRVQSAGSNFTGMGHFKFALVTSTNTSRQATATATVSGGFLTIVTMTDMGLGYISAPNVVPVGGGGSGAILTAQVYGGMVTNIMVNNPGSGYATTPIIVIDPPPDTADYTTWWSNDGTSVDGSEPTDAVSVSVQDGLFTVRLGDTNVPNMMPLDPALFHIPDLELRLWFDDGVNGFSTLSPTQPLSAAPYAMMASHAMAVELASGSVSNAALATGAVTTEKIAAGTIETNNLSAEVISLLAGGSTSWQLGGNAGTTAGTDFLGTTDNQPLELKVNGLRGLRLEPTVNDADHSDIVNVLGGSPANVVGPGVYGATIAGGGEVNLFGVPGTNRVDAHFGTIGGGYLNTIQTNAVSSTIGGGSANTIQTVASHSTIGGGRANTIQTYATTSTIGGGSANTIQGGAADATIGGGSANTIQSDADYSSIGGGWQNSIQTSAYRSTISGGYFNTIQSHADYSSIGGGFENTIQSDADSSTIGGGFANTIQTNADHSTIGGGYLNTIQTNADYSTIGGGGGNTIQTNAVSSTIGGGFENTIQTNAEHSTIGGGYQNTVETSANYSTIGGGWYNTIQSYAEHSTIGGGRYNTIQTNAVSSTIGGGWNNTNLARARYAIIPGGYQNAATNYAFAAGFRAKAIHTGAFVWSDSAGSAFSSTAANQFSVRALGGVRFETGGTGLSVDGQTLISGGTLTGNASGLTNLDASQLLLGTVPDAVLDSKVARTNQVWLLGGNADTTPGTDFLGTTDNQPLELKVNGLRGWRLEPTVDDSFHEGIVNVVGGSPANVVGPGVYGAVIGGGGAVNWNGQPLTNTIQSGANYSTIGGGGVNTIEANSYSSTIGGGWNNTIEAYAYNSTIGGGVVNTIEAYAYYSTIGGGGYNTIQTNAHHSTIGGGRYNTIQTNAYHSTIGGGYLNTNLANAWYATIPGGFLNAATNYAFAAGRRAKAIHTGAFVWADHQSTDFPSTAANEVSFRCSGGARFTSGSAGANQTVSWAPGSGTWSFSSDRNLKAGFAPVDRKDVLDKISRLPITQWHYKGYPQQHIGPVAQDFHALFPLNENETMLNSADLGGVALVAIQGLNEKLEETRAENAELRQRLEQLEELLSSRNGGEK